MSDEKQNQKPADELSKDDLEKVTGGTFANFGDIKGETTDKDHKDWVTILQYDHAVTAPAPLK